MNLKQLHEGQSVDLEGQQWVADNAASILDAVVDAIITINATGIILSLNTATERLFGYSAEELVEQPVAILMPEPYKSEHQAYVSSFIATRDPKIIGVGRELTAQRKDGSIFPIYLAVSEVPGGKHFVGIIRDLSVQKAAEQALAEQKERVAQVGRLTTMGEMTASIAHEINQPLTAISMYAQASIRLLAKPNHDTEKIKTTLEKLNEQSLRAGDVVERIQRFMQNAGADRAIHDVNELLRDIRRLAAGDARLHGIDLRLELDPELPQVFCDAVQIQQVALNLVRNAVDAMFEIDCHSGTTVVVRTQRRDGMVEISVTDQGPGIQPDQEDKLFTAFHSTKRDGMGMGLSICRSIIQDHDGLLDFRNNPDCGATFFFCIPYGELHE